MSLPLYRLIRRLASPLRPGRLYGRFRRYADPRGLNHLRLWLRALDPRRVAATARWARALRATILARRRERRLTVAVDVSAFWEPLTGIGWYLYRLLEHLAERDDLRLRLYGIDFIAKPGIPGPLTAPPAGKAIEVVSYRVPENLSIVHYYLADRLRGWQDRLIAADRNRLLFAPNYFLPPWFDRCDGRLVATVHDLGFLKVPATLRESTRRDLERHLERTMARAERVLTDSETVRRELLASGLVAASRVTAVPLGPGAASAAGDAEPPAGTPARYVLHVGTIEPRKNLPTLFAAWRLLRRRGETPPALVLAGGPGWKSDRLEAEIASAVEAGWLHRFGYLSDRRIAALYRRALLVVLPSVYEGFGLPAVEAMTAGAPLLCSDIPVLREVAGDAARYAPPDRPEAWAARVAELLADDRSRAELGRRGRRRARRFDWRRTADATAAVFHAAAAEAAPS